MIIHLPESFNEPATVERGLIAACGFTGAGSYVETRDEWWQVNCARCLNSPRGLELMRQAEATAAQNAGTMANAGTHLSLAQFNALHLHSASDFDHLNGTPV